MAITHATVPLTLDFSGRPSVHNLDLGEGVVQLKAVYDAVVKRLAEYASILGTARLLVDAVELPEEPEHVIACPGTFALRLAVSFDSKSGPYEFGFDLESHNEFVNFSKFLSEFSLQVGEIIVSIPLFRLGGLKYPA